MFERARNFLVLVVPVDAKAPLTLLGIFAAEFGGVEAQLFRSGNSFRFCFRYTCTH